jgi:peptidoglycan/LPS O-acetylase OafA/YrhL
LLYFLIKKIPQNYFTSLKNLFYSKLILWSIYNYNINENKELKTNMNLYTNLVIFQYIKIAFFLSILWSKIFKKGKNILLIYYIINIIYVVSVMII